MEDVLGARTDAARFAALLADWESVLHRRIAAATAAIAAIPGVAGLVLAGSAGRDELWPLSDIDLLPIFEADQVAPARAEIERRRAELMAGWAEEGWCTGLDVGKLAFTRTEVISALAQGDHELPSVLADDRWYHSLDKGYRGRAAHDPDGLAGQLAAWLTTHRFRPEVVALRQARARRETEAAVRSFHANLAAEDTLAATKALLAAVHWLRIDLIERWGGRDNSFGRFGTRFDRVARERGQPDLSDALNRLSDLDDASVTRRMAVAPDWVWERHDRSWRARAQIGEGVTRLQDAHDVLRVSTQYELRRIAAPPYPAWLAIPDDIAALEEKEPRLAALLAAAETVE